MAVTNGRSTKKSKEELVRHDSGQSSSRDTPVSSTEGEFDEEEEEDEDDDDVEEEEEEEEEEEGTANNVRFDEQFLAQLLAFDSSLAGQSFNNNALPRSQSNKVHHSAGLDLGSTSIPPNSFSSIDESNARHTPTNSSSLPLSAPTPSNEFYDGAINFLTEVLGSSTPSFWNGDTSLAQAAGQLNKWAGQSNTPSASVAPIDFATPGSQAAKTDFTNLQPLISNLIARLKGSPVQDGQQIGQTLEDDLVILLQSLMAHRQAQQNRQAQEQLNQSIDLLQSVPLNSTSTGLVTNSSFCAPPFSGLPSSSITNSQPYPSQPGFSIVDFDFGDDDDDPDFVPNNVNLDFANSKDFADALAQVSAAPIAPLPPADKSNGSLNVDDASWQQVMSVLQSRDDSANKGEGASFPSHWEDSNQFRRTRSATRNVEMMEGEGEDAASMQSGRARSLIFENERSQSRGIDYDRGDSNESDHDEEGRSGDKKRGRKPLSREEALVRRRESNRECSRRSRLRKKQEEEEIKQEFVRIQKLRNVSQETENDVAGLPAGLRKKKRGRPFGSKSYANREGSEGATQGDNDDRVADLKADNRMLRAEMQRLIEENAQLRARMLRVEEGGPSGATSSRVTRSNEESRRSQDKSHKRRDYRDLIPRNLDYHSRYDEESMSESEEDFHERSRAARHLPYDPIKSFHPPISSRRSYPEQVGEANGNKRKRIEDVHHGAAPTPSIEQLLRGFAAYQQGGPAAMPDNFPAMTNQRRGPSALM